MTRRVERPSREDLARRYLANASTTQLAAHYGVAQATVSRWLKAMGIPARSQGAQFGDWTKDLPMQEIIRLYSEELWTAKRIAKFYGVRQNTIVRRLKTAGVNVLIGRPAYCRKQANRLAA